VLETALGPLVMPSCKGSFARQKTSRSGWQDLGISYDHDSSRSLKSLAGSLKIGEQGPFEARETHHAMVGYECGRCRPFPIVPGPEIRLPSICSSSAGSIASCRKSRASQPSRASPTSGPCRGLAAAAQGFASQRARAGAAERPSLSFPAGGTAAAVATTTQIFRESSAPGTATRAAVDGPHGEPQVHVAAPDARAAAARAADS
jgi:hypothetical protein